MTKMRMTDRLRKMDPELILEPECENLIEYVLKVVEQPRGQSVRSVPSRLFLGFL
jgi:hypothetical protein